MVFVEEIPRMVKPALRVAAAFALLLVLAAPGGAGAAEDTLWTFPDTGERITAARRDASSLARSFLPGPADLGPGWYRPWEAPRGVPGLLRDEATWWNRLEVAPAWGQFFGLEEEAITQRVRERLDEVFASFAGQAAPAGVPPEFQAMASSKPAFLSVPMMRLRQFTMLVQMPQVLAVSKLETVGHAYLKARFTKKPEEVEATIARQFPDLLRALDANLEGQSYEDALRAYAREARNVRRHTRMVFVRADAEAWANPDLQKMPDYAVFTVDLSVLARSAIGTWIRDVTPEDAGRVQQDVASSLAKTWALTREIAGLQAGKQREALATEIDARCPRRGGRVAARGAARRAGRTSGAARCGRSGPAHARDARPRGQRVGPLPRRTAADPAEEVRGPPGAAPQRERRRRRPRAGHLPQGGARARRSSTCSARWTSGRRSSSRTSRRTRSLAMTSRSFVRYPRALVLTLLGLLAAASKGRGAEDRHEAEAAARTILSAVQDRVIATGAVAPNLLEEVTTTCEEDRVYCKAVDLGDEAKTRLNIRVDLTGRFQTTNDIPVPRRWEGVPVERDAVADAVVRTRSVETRQGTRAVVDMRAAHQGVYFYMGSSQLAAGRTVKLSVRFAASRFQKMVEAAKANGLIGEDLPRVVERSGEQVGRELSDGDVVYVTVAQDGPVTAVLDVFARPSTVPAGQEHEILVDLPSLDAGRRAGVRVGPSAEATDRGFRIRSTRTEAVPVQIELTRALFDALRKGRYTSRLGTVLPVVIRGGGGKRRIFLQFSEWAVVVSRFELRGLDDPQLSRLRSDMAERLGERAVAAGPFRQFNEEREILGNLRDAWADLLPRVTPGHPRNTEKIVSAWARNQETGEDLVLGVHKPEDPTSGARFVGVDHRPEFEILVLRDPPFVPRAESDEDLGLDGLGAEGGFDESRQLDGFGIDTDRAHEETWKRFFVDALDVDVRPLEALDGDAGDPATALFRLEPWGGQWRDELDRERAIARFVALNWAVPPQPLPPYRTHAPGLYEFHLSVTIGRKDAPQDKQSVAVAIRVRLVRPDVGIRTLSFETQRGR